MELSALEKEQIIKTEIDLNETSLDQDYPPLISIKRDFDTFNQSDMVEILDSIYVKTEPNCNCNSAVYVKNDEVKCHGFRCDLCNLLLTDHYNLTIHCKSHVDQSGIHLMSETMSQYLFRNSDNVSSISSSKRDSKSINDVQTPISQYTCDLCNKKMHRKKYVKDHINRVHNTVAR